MKTFRNIFLILPVLALAGLVSCVGEPEKPAAPDTDLKANITIEGLIDLFGNTDYAEIDDNLYIEGVVVGNDISGNIYKKIFLQDATAGIDIEIEMTNNCHKYPVGQRLVIELKGLAFGRYSGQPQIAARGDNATARLYEVECDKHFYRKGYASAANLPQPILLNIGDIQFRPRHYVGRLIRIDSVYFEDGGETFASSSDNSASNRNLVDMNGNKLVCRNSTKALFANDIMPKGFVNVQGILGIYVSSETTPQLYFRDINDIVVLNDSIQ